MGGVGVERVRLGVVRAVDVYVHDRVPTEGLRNGGRFEVLTLGVRLKGVSEESTMECPVVVAVASVEEPSLCPR